MTVVRTSIMHIVWRLFIVTFLLGTVEGQQQQDGGYYYNDDPYGNDNTNYYGTGGVAADDPGAAAGGSDNLYHDYAARQYNKENRYVCFELT